MVGELKHCANVLFSQIPFTDFSWTGLHLTSLSLVDLAVVCITLATLKEEYRLKQYFNI